MARYTNGTGKERQCQMCDTYVRDDDLLISTMEHGGRTKEFTGLCPKCHVPMYQMVRHPNDELLYWVPVTLSQEYIEDYRNGLLQNHN